MYTNAIDECNLVEIVVEFTKDEVNVMIMSNMVYSHSCPQN